MSSLSVSLESPEALRTLFEEQLSKGRSVAVGIARGHGPGALRGHPGGLGTDPPLAGRGRAHPVDEPGVGVGLQLARLDDAGFAELRAFVEWKEEEEPRGEPSGERQNAMNALHARLSGMNAVQQQRLAANGGLSERVALERLFGPNVWESLLHNPRITPPEVARIARKGTLPRPLVELIAANAGWLATGEVQRALLSNPRSTPVVIGKVLRAMPRPDLLLVPTQTAYPAQVREAARRKLGR